MSDWIDFIYDHFENWQESSGFGYFLQLPAFERNYIIIVLHVGGDKCCYVKFLDFQLNRTFDNMLGHKLYQDCFR